MHLPCRIPEALKKEICDKRRAAPVLEAEADQLDQQGRACEAKARRSKARHFRRMADTLEEIVDRMEQDTGQVQCMHWYQEGL